MNKNTANSQQFLGRVGNASTKPSARGVNLLGWETPEKLTGPQQLECLRARVKQLNGAVIDPSLPKTEKKAMGQEIFKLITEIAAMKPPKGPSENVNVADFIMEVVKEKRPA